jgi:hypothetical protein
MTVAPNGDVYAVDYGNLGSGGDIYKQTGGAGNFNALSQTHRNWRGITATPNGDIYASVYNGDIYKQTGGIGDFIATGQTPNNWYGMTSTVNGDVYVASISGDIYRSSSAPSITAQPVSLTKSVRDKATFSVTATGYPIPSYQWYQGNIPLTNSEKVSGATTSTLILNNLSLNEAGGYRVRVYNGESPDAISSTVLLNVLTEEIFGNGHGSRNLIVNVNKFGKIFGSMQDFSG